MESFVFPEVSDECDDVSDLCLVGKILTPKSLNRTAVSNILLGAWKTRASVSISPWTDKVFLFQFAEAQDWRKVLSEAPWSVMGQSLGSSTSSDRVSDGGDRVSVVPLLGSSPWNFLRLRVEVDVTKPLLQGFNLHRRGSKDQGEGDIIVRYKFEKLPEFCYDCGRIGHDNVTCTFLTREEGKDFEYGPEMRTGIAQSSGLPFEPSRKHMEGKNFRVQPGSHHSHEPASNLAMAHGPSVLQEHFPTASSRVVDDSVQPVR
ncbi:hypothetical protein ACSBR1_030171 [Camellia fascicularis]